VFRGAAVDGAVAIGKHRFEKAVVMVQDQLPNPNLGGRALRDFALTFDQRAKSIRFERTRVSPPEAFAPPSRAPGQSVVQGPPPGGKSAGVMLSPQPDGGLLVAGTLPGSAASRADIAAGDHVVKLNGQPVESMNDEARLGALHHSPVTLTVVRGERTFEVTLEF
jgi:S1-C subfamily serine protease